MTQANPFSKLNTNLITKILRNIKPVDFINCVITCKLLNKYAFNDEVISKLCHDRLMEIIPDDMREHFKTMVIPDVEIFSPYNAMTLSDVLLTMEFGSIGYPNYTKKWLLSCMLNDITMIRQAKDDSCPKSLINGYWIHEMNLFIGEFKITGITKTDYGIRQCNGIRINLKNKSAVIGTIKINRYNPDYYIFDDDDNDDIISCDMRYLLHNTGFLISSEYIGSVKDGLKHGIGKHICNLRFVYEGSFENGKRHGIGKLISRKGEYTYEGDFVNDNMHGRGKLTGINGSTFEGNWTGCKKHGYGIAAYKSEIQYIGYYVDNKCDGLGTIYHYDGSSWAGNGRTVCH